MLRGDDTSSHAFPTVRVDAAGLWLDGALTLPREKIRSVVLVLEERTTVQILSVDATPTKIARPGTGRYAFTFTNPRDVDAMLVALGRNPARVPVSTALETSLFGRGFAPLPRSTLAAIVGSLVLSTIAAFALPSWRGLWLYLLLMVVFITVQSLQRSLTIGADGVRAHGRAGEGFVAYRDLASVTARAGALAFTLRDGRTVLMAVRHAARIPELLVEIERRRAESAAVESVETDLAGALRGATTAPETIASLRQLGTESDSSYREGRIPRERLWSIVEDPHAEAATRARAAVALSGEFGEGDRQRLRIATETTVSPKIRVAMDAIEQGSDERLAEHLEELTEVVRRRAPG